MQTCRRRQPRYTLRGDSAVVEFRFPEGEGGRDFRMAVADVSASGLGFFLSESLPSVELGTSIPNATLRRGDRTISMDLLVLHVTQQFAGEPVCGCLFYPASDGDLRAFKDLLNDLAALPVTS